MKYLTHYVISVILLVLLSACSGNEEESDSLKEPENIGVPVTIHDDDCEGENYQITDRDGEILKYCLPVDTKSAAEFVSAYNQSSIETNSVSLDESDPNEFYRGAEDVYDDIALNFDQYTAVDKVHHVFIFAEFISTVERENQLQEVMFNSIKAFNTSLSTSEVEDIVSRLMEDMITPQTHIEFDYKNNFYRIEIDNLEAVAITIRSNEFNGAY